MAGVDVFIAASEAERHDRLLNGVIGANIGALLGLAMLFRRRRARLPRRHSAAPPLGWGYVSNMYAGWWAIVVGLGVALLEVGSPRPAEVAGYAVFVLLAIGTGVLLVRERGSSADREPGRAPGRRR